MDLGCPRSPNQRQRDPWRGASLQAGGHRLGNQADLRSSLHNSALQGRLHFVRRRIPHGPTLGSTAQVIFRSSCAVPSECSRQARSSRRLTAVQGS